jgi:hypothetical protein
MEVIASLLFPLLGKPGGIVGINSFLVGFALAKADDFARHEINSWKEKHSGFVNCR